jgi:short-subunit dehydrogenase
LLNEFDRLTYTSAEKAAKEIIKGVQKNKRRIMIGMDAKLADILVRLFPGTYEKIMGLEERVSRLTKL